VQIIPFTRSLREKDLNFSVAGFSVYKPSPCFKKSNPPSVDFHVLVYQASESVPNFSLLQKTKIAIVDGSNISFLSTSIR
jgi:hypothetical protein